jgi:hypothetical protein
MKRTKATKRRRFSNKKTHRNKKRGGMYKHLTPRQRAEVLAKERKDANKKEITTLMKRMAGHSPGASPAFRMAALTGKPGAVAGHVASSFFAEPNMSIKTTADHAKLTLDMARPKLIDAEDMFQRAERLCLTVKDLPAGDMWKKVGFTMACSETASRMCMEAVELYKGAIKRKYLPAYAPLAWLMSYSRPQESLQLCDECVAACDGDAKIPAHSAGLAREARVDCTAIRAFVEYEQFKSMPRAAAGSPSMTALEKVERDSAGSKYGHALRWLRLSHAGEAKEAGEAKLVAETMGMDFKHCRLCVPAVGRAEIGRIRSKKGSSGQ